MSDSATHDVSQTASTTFTVSFCSSSYTGGLAAIMKELHMSSEVGILGVSLYVLGFGLGYGDFPQALYFTYLRCYG